MSDIFITEDFMLSNSKAVDLYHLYAKDLPIIDYHNHLSPQHIADNIRFGNIAQAWLYGDHYKWRQMRTNGVAERLCTGDASDREKFQAWAETVPKTLCNPLYHWTHLELKRYFGIADRLLSAQTAESIWNDCNAIIARPDFTARSMITRMNVTVLCTTDDPADSLEHHRRIAADPSFAVKVLPTFRPDRAMTAEDPAAYNAWIAKLEQAADTAVSSYSNLIDALAKRHDFFHAAGCRISDHGMDTAYADDYTESEINDIFTRVRSGKPLDADALSKLKSAVLYDCALMDHKKGWTQQLHLGPMRNNNTRMFRQLGPDTGFDSIGDRTVAHQLSRFLDRLDRTGSLAKTILYNLNPRDNEVLATMCGNFQDGIIPGKIQFGSAWWFMDQKSGMERQLDCLATLGLLSRFVGMLTDSRSLLSFPRHEYFRRILCNYLGVQMEQGLLPDDITLIGTMTADICYNNAQGYFGF